MAEQSNGQGDREFRLSRETEHLLDQPTTQRVAYSDRTAWLMSQLSEIAYIEFEDSEEEKSRLVSEAEKAGFQIAEFFNETVVAVEKHAKEKNLKDEAVTDTQAILLVSQKRNQAVLAFRGSEPNKTDWLLTDADAVFVNLGSDADGDGLEERVHRGFYESYYSVRGKLSDSVRAKIPDGMPLYVTGHSLGGALASIAGYELEKVRPLAAVYTFGAPRVGNPEWGQLTKVPVYRIVNHRDMVPLLPFSNFFGDLLTRMGLGWLVRWIRKRMVGFFGFQHMGDMRYLTATGELKLGSDAAVTRLLTVYFDSFWVIFRRHWRKIFKQGMEFGTDHFMSGYITKLEGIALKRNPKSPDKT